ncbi:Glucose-resistance amylase regulator [Sphingobacterium spiritivorum]|uniref:Glucose-resistance amylase regulator n=1 Tax=Sphingobacterium spiritivorum TaxID=258 RepID=A0A380CFD7_SPHSI|nr:LacI family DNA-binding transcriptional regulator [Sphingobacterium spiritivorum]SUJ17832.1 Glucose-resistance amylase regulator [Sphingobacterium spiritivorum]
MSSITIKEIAKALNVSISTVSKALNDSHEIGEKTKKRVLEYAEAHHYKPNLLAQNLKTGKSNTIGVILTSINNPFCSQIIEGIQQHALKVGFEVIFMQSRENPEIERSCIETLMQRGVDGLLISPVDETSNQKLLEDIHDHNFPVVIFDRIQHNLETFKIGVNNFQGAYLATKHLIDSGRTKIVNITASRFGLSGERFKGYHQALTNAGIAFDDQFHIQCNMQNQEVLDVELKNAITRLMNAENKPDAILGSSDTITVTLLGVLAELGYSVPDELAVIGFSNIDFARSLNPALSTIRQPALEIGDMAMEKLMKFIAKKNWHQVQIETTELDTILTFRKSSIQS